MSGSTVIASWNSLFYLLVAETFAPLAECLLFWLAFGKEAQWRDFGVIAIANLASFLVGEVIF